MGFPANPTVGQIVNDGGKNYKYTALGTWDEVIVSLNLPFKSSKGMLRNNGAGGLSWKAGTNCFSVLGITAPPTTFSGNLLVDDVTDINPPTIWVWSGANRKYVERVIYEKQLTTFAENIYVKPPEHKQITTFATRGAKHIAVFNNEGKDYFFVSNYKTTVNGVDELGVFSDFFEINSGGTVTHRSPHHYLKGQYKTIFYQHAGKSYLLFIGNSDYTDAEIILTELQSGVNLTDRGYAYVTFASDGIVFPDVTGNTGSAGNSRYIIFSGGDFQGNDADGQIGTINYTTDVADDMKYVAPLDTPSGKRFAPIQFTEAGEGYISFFNLYSKPEDVSKSGYYTYSMKSNRFNSAEESILHNTDGFYSAVQHDVDGVHYVIVGSKPHFKILKREGTTFSIFLSPTTKAGSPAGTYQKGNNIYIFLAGGYMSTESYVYKWTPGSDPELILTFALESVSDGKFVTKDGKDYVIIARERNNGATGDNGAASPYDVNSYMYEITGLN